MKHKLILLPALLISFAAMAQLPEDVLKYSWQPVNGTARMNATGGATGALGGDITSVFTNPAGIALYKTNEFVISPGHLSYKNKSNFRGTNASDDNNGFNLGPSGIVFAKPSRNGGNWQNSTFSIAVNRTANFNSNIYYEGQNNFSSFAEQYAEDAGKTKQSIDDILGPNSRAAIPTQMILYVYGIDTLTTNGKTKFESIALRDNLQNNSDFLLNQAHSIKTRGGVTEPSIAFAGNQNDKFYLGGAVGVPIVNFEKRSFLYEEDATGNDDNDFDFASLLEKFTTRGVGINVKLGILFKPTEMIRMGIAVNSPTWYSFKDGYSSSFRLSSENFRSRASARDTTIQSEFFTGNSTAFYNYELITPWKLMFSGAYVLRGSEDVRQQKGFISADVEYITYKSQQFRNGEDFENDSYYDDLTDVIKDYYKNAFNFRIGGELKFNTMMARAGFSYYGSPYADSELDGSRMFISGGLGYRHSGMFIDLSYTYGINKDVNFPYRLSDKANTFANIKGNSGQVALTLGFKI